MTCLFCTIITGEVPAARVLDHPDAVAFLDKAPVFPGHVLVVPRQHIVTLPDMPVEDLGPFFAQVQRIAIGVQTALGCDGTWISMNNIVSQSVPHLHVHVVPRVRKDGLKGFYWPRQKYVDEAAMLTMALRITESLQH
jgi:histidine triad (HIT) family protein